MRPRGFVVLYAMLAMSTLVGLTALAVDFGHIQAAKFELRDACDAAANAAAQCIGSNTLTTAQQIASASNAAIAIASQNTVDGQPVLLDASMIFVGNYDSTLSPNFLTGRLPFNAVQINAYRDHLHNNPISLFLASMVGVTSCDIRATSIAQKPTAVSTYGIVGVQHASFACLGAASTLDGSLVSNGNVSVGMPLGVGIAVNKDLRSYSGSVTHGSLVTVAGSCGSLPATLNYPSVSAPASFDNSAIAPQLDAYNNYAATGYADIPAGTYVVHDLNLLAGLSVNLHGLTNFYITGTFNMAATVKLMNVLNTVPGNFNIYIVPGGHVNIVGDLLTPICMNLYAPDSSINIAVSVNHFTGSLIGKTLDISLPVLGTFTETAPPTQFIETKLVQ